jgi:hypothetical protein
MPKLRFHSRFLLRGTGLLTGLLVLWWFVLMNPLLFLLRESVGICEGLVFGSNATRLVTETSNGDWTFEVPIEVIVPGSFAKPAPTRIHSIDFDLARSDAGAFTFGLPVYWAIILAVPGIRRGLRPLFLGSLIMALVEIILLLMFAEIFAHKMALQLSQSQSAMSSWLLHFAEYLVVGVIPYATPFLVALGLRRELRAQIFRQGEPTNSPKPSPRDRLSGSQRNPLPDSAGVRVAHGARKKSTGQESLAYRPGPNPTRDRTLP